MNIEKGKTPGLFTLLLLVLALGIVASGYVGQKYVRHMIHVEAVHQAQQAAVAFDKQQAADRYNLNHTGCAFRKIVAPQLASLDRARHDLTMSESARDRAAVTYAKTKRLLAVWTTIPPDFDCSTLAPDPPQVK